MISPSSRNLRENEQTRLIEPKSISIRAPGGGSTVRMASMAIGCSQCGRPMPQEILNKLPVKGGAHKPLVCPACGIINSEKRRVQRRNLLVVVAIAVLVIAGIGVIFPQPALFLLALAGFASIAVGVLGFTWERVARLSMVAAGLGIMFAALALLWTLKDRETERNARLEMVQKASAISKLLEADRFVEAHEAAERLQIEVREQPETYGSNEIREVVAKACQERDQWVERHYEGLSPDGRQLLLSLLRLFPNAQGIRGQRVRYMQVTGGDVKLTMVLPSEDASVSVRTGDPRATAARMILLCIFDGIPNVNSIWLTLVPADDAGSPEAGGTYIVKKEQAVSLRMGELPQREEDRPK